MLEILTPSLHVRRFTEVPVYWLKDAGFMALSLDVDKTFMGQHGTELSTEVQEKFIEVDESGIKLALTSNAPKKHRHERVAEIGLRIGQLTHSEVIISTSFKLSAPGKPNRALFDYTAEELGVAAGQICHVGDQILKDVYGANMAGYGGTVLVAPYGEGDHPGVRYVQRPIEALIRPALRLPFLTRNFPERPNYHINNATIRPDELHEGTEPAVQTWPNNAV
jgi:HAD superfamily phosphatase (TIGR01668 family)